MRTITLRELQTRGVSALEGGSGMILVEASGASFFVIPVLKGLERCQGGLLSRTVAKCLLLQSGLQARSTRLVDMAMEEITAEVKAVRKARIARKARGQGKAEQP